MSIPALQPQVVAEFQRNFGDRLCRSRIAVLERAVTSSEIAREDLESVLSTVAGMSETKRWIELAQQYGATKGQTARMVLVDIARGQADLDQALMNDTVTASRDDRAAVATKAYAKIDLFEDRLMVAVESAWNIALSTGIREMSMNMRCITNFFAARLPAIGTALMLLPPLDPNGEPGIRAGRAVQSPFLRMDAMVRRVNSMPWVDMKSEVAPRVPMAARAAALETTLQAPSPFKRDDE